MEKYWPYLFVSLSAYLVLYQVGIWKLIYKAIKQVIVMALMVICCVLWYVLMSQHIAVIAQVSTTSVLSVLNDIASGSVSEVMANPQIMSPLTEMMVITGATMFILGVLYRQLPIDLIPDCIPCVGHYDNMLAAVGAFLGVILCGLGMYCQIHFGDGPSSTASLWTKWEDFVQRQDEQKWEDVVAALQHSAQRTMAILQESGTFISKQIQQKMEQNSARNEL